MTMQVDRSRTVNRCREALDPDRPHGIAIIIASTGRPTELGRWIEHVGRQTLKPVEMIWAVRDSNDLPPGARNDPDVPLRIVQSPLGSASQRNAALDALAGDAAFVAFFDDDYVPTRTCLADIIASFYALPDAAGLTGLLLADGINGPGVDYATALALVAHHAAGSVDGVPPSLTFERWDGLYGCNMAFRAPLLRDLRFDERLPLYAWQEDVDFAMRVAGGRPIGRTNGFAGVHQGVKRGRTNGKRFGYSQIVNPAYLRAKGSMSWRKMLRLTSGNVVANHLRVLRPEPWVDRRGRLIGNWLALLDLARGRAYPERILEFP